MTTKTFSTIKPENENISSRLDSDIYQLSVADIQARVALLLDFAVSRNHLDVGPEFIAKTLPLLRKDYSKITAAEEIDLWTCYDKLAVLVAPSTVTSIRLAYELEASEGPRTDKTGPDKKTFAWAHACRRQIRRIIIFLLVLVVFYVVIQVYVILLTDAVRYAAKANAEEQAVGMQIVAAQQATGNSSIEETPSAIGLLWQQKNAKLHSDAAYAVLLKVSRPWLWAIRENLPTSASERIQAKIAAEQGATSVLGALAQYILPLILGLLGATAYIVRRTLDDLASNAYLVGSGTPTLMRIALGGLLGVISGIIVGPDTSVPRSFSLSLVAFALLMGYSVEFAFSIFDSLIERGRRAVKQKPEAAPVSSDAREARIVPNGSR